MKTGVELIAAERQRQIKEEGWTSKHDDKHHKGEMAKAACYYAWPWIRTATSIMWPGSWDGAWAKKGHNDQPIAGRVRDLAKAGALIAAELERLQRLADLATPRGVA